MTSGPQCDLLVLRQLGLLDVARLPKADLAGLEPRLQQLALRQGPEQLLRLLNRQRPPTPLALLAHSREGAVAGALIAEPCNRRGSCWRIDALTINAAVSNRSDTSVLLIRDALSQVQGAVSWTARASINDTALLSGLREQGFQTLQQQRLWRLESSEQLEYSEALPQQLELQPLDRNNAALLLQLELSATPAHLRQMQDLRSEDLLDDALPGSLLLIDTQRHQAVAAARLLRRRQQGSTEVELNLHPAWTQLLGPPLGRLLEQACRRSMPITLRCDVRNSPGMAWLESQGAISLREELVLARSLWRRQELPAMAGLASRTLERLVGQLQPNQRPVPEAMLWR